MASSSKGKVPLVLSALIIAGLVLTYFIFPDFQNSVKEGWKAFTSGGHHQAKQWISQFGILGPIVIILIMILQMFLIVIPTPILMIVAVIAYGPFIGSAISLAAIFSASTIGYYIGKYFGASVIHKIIGKRAEKKLASFIEDYGFWTVVVIRLNPFLSNDAVSLVAGILEMGYRKFIAATLLGIFPLVFLIGYFGMDYEKLKPALGWGSLAFFLIFIGLIVWDKKYRASH